MRVPTPNARDGSWRARHRRRHNQRETVRLHLLAAGTTPPPATRYRVLLERLSARALDSDNLAYALKAPRDEVAAWLGFNDGPLSPIEWRYGQGKPAPHHPRGYQAVRITIEGRGT